MRTWQSNKEMSPMALTSTLPESSASIPKHFVFFSNRGTKLFFPLGGVKKKATFVPGVSADRRTDEVKTGAVQCMV